jgi:hypothetical protein
MPNVHDEVETYRRQVQRVLASQEFAGSRQQRDFLSYVADAAFQKRSRLDQVEIAREVLHKGDDFDPVYDPAVRKLATLTRQRLESYYTNEGAADPILISLPIRTYIPHFQERAEPLGEITAPAAAAVPEETVPPVEEVERPAKRGWILVAAVAVVLVITAAVVLGSRFRAETQTGEFVLTSVRGDIMHESNELVPTAIQLGPKLGPVDQVTVRMRFAPDRATQQAGIMIYENPDRYVKFGRQFLSRSQLEFGLETGARYQKPPNTFAYDPRGQTGEPIWLSIRRNRNEYTAWVSYDGYEWRSFGNALVMPDPMPEARVAVFAHNGRSDAPPREARFDKLTVGLDFFGYPAGTTIPDLSGWNLSSGACSAPLFDASPGVLLPFGAEPQSCNTELTRPIPPGDWTVSTEVEFSGSGTAAGLMCRGTKGRFRIILWDLNGFSISAEHLGHNQVNRSNFPGNPPVILRMSNRGGILQGSYSRDGIEFEAIDLEVPLEQLGKDVEIGLHSAKSTWGSSTAPPPPRFRYLHQDILQLSNYR